MTTLPRDEAIKILSLKLARIIPGARFLRFIVGDRASDVEDQICKSFVDGIIKALEQYSFEDLTWVIEDASDGLTEEELDRHIDALTNLADSFCFEIPLPATIRKILLRPLVRYAAMHGAAGFSVILGNVDKEQANAEIDQAIEAASAIT